MAQDIDRRLQKFEDALVNVLTNVDDKLDSKLRKKLQKARTKLKKDPDYSRKKYKKAVLRAHEQEDEDGPVTGDEKPRQA
jgi:hypothetical protein